MNLAYLFNCMHTSVIRFVWSAVACIVNIALKISPKKKKKKTCEEIILKWFCLNDGWQAKLVCTHSTPFFLRTCYLALAQLCSQGWKDKKAHKALSEFFFFFFFFALHLRRDACGEWCDARLILLKRGLWCKLPLCWMSRLSEIFISAMAVVCWGAGTFFLKSVNQRYSLFFIFIVFMWIACIIKQFNPCEVKLSNTLIIIMLTWYETLYFLYFFLDFGCCDIVRWCKGCLFLVLKAV